eukprot:363938-Chlamydomonas_euryale.AAC.13
MTAYGPFCIRLTAPSAAVAKLTFHVTTLLSFPHSLAAGISIALLAPSHACFVFTFAVLLAAFTRLHVLHEGSIPFAGPLPVTHLPRETFSHNRMHRVAAFNTNSCGSRLGSAIECQSVVPANYRS